MSMFRNELKNNNLVCSECLRCKRMVWPPNDICNKCFGSVTWRKLSRDAILVEFSRKGDEYFCIAELEGQIRLMGTLRGSLCLEVGDKLVLDQCDYDGEEKFFFKLKEKK